jgi:peroxiredoxin
MKKRSLMVYIAALLVLISSSPLFAAETNDASTSVSGAALSPANADLNNLITRVNEKIKQDKTSESDLADNLKEFDALLIKHKDARPEELANILVMKAQLYMQVLGEPGKAAEVFQQIKKDYPIVKLNGNIDAVIASLQAAAEKKKVQDALKPGTPFPDFSETDLEGKPLSIAKYKGKVVLVDFWATWCMPCVAQLPDVQKAYEKFHGKGFEIVGISLDEDKDRLQQFIKQRKMPWQEYFDGKKWENKLAAKYGVEAIPSSYLIDQQGKIITKVANGEQLEPAIAKALGK